MSYYRNHLPLSGASGQSTGFTIDQSIRFNDDDSAYMHRTPSSGGNSDKWTWSAWVKRGNLTDANATMFHSGDDSNTNNYNQILFNGNSGGTPTLKFNSVIGGSTVLNLATTQYFRDFSAWYHIVVVYDSGNVVSSERARIYLNGVRITSFGTQTYPSQNQDSMVNHTVKHSIGRRNLDSSRYMDGYMAEIHLLDGYAYDSSYFGEFKEDTDIWIPKKYDGSYGTNGFYIKGESSGALGNDSSGNNNDFSTSGLAAHDQVTDSPTNSFCTINPAADINSTVNTLSEGNLKSAGSSSSIWHISPCTHLLPSGKWYFEGRLNTASNNSRFAIGLIPTSPMLSANYGNLPSSVANSSGFSLQLDSNSQGLLWYAYSGSGQYVTISVDTDEVGTIGHFAIDVDNQKIWAGINGTYYNSSGGGDGNPSSGSNPTYSGTTNFSTGPLVPFIGNYINSCQGVLNFGQDGTFAGTETAQGNKDSSGIGNFKYSVPTGFKAICTKNLGS